MAYDENYYLTHLGPEPCTFESEVWKNFCDEVARQINDLYHPASVIDAGCGLGLLIRSLRDIGISAWGFDSSTYAANKAQEHDLEVYWHSLLDAPVDMADLVLCVEVLEHIEEQFADVCVRNLCNMSAHLVIFSSSPYDLTEPSHVNVQPEEYWLKKFEANGFKKIGRAEYISPWAMVLGRVDG